MRVIELTLAEACPLQNEIRGKHYRTYAKLRERMAWLIRQAMFKAGVKLPEQPLEFARVEIVRGSCSSRLDWDGLYGGVKPLLDCLVVRHPKTHPNGLGFIRDDDTHHLVALTVRPQKTRRGEKWTRITITEEATP